MTLMGACLSAPTPTCFLLEPLPSVMLFSRLVTPEIIERPGLARRVVTVPTEEPKSAARRKIAKNPGGREAE